MPETFFAKTSSSPSAVAIDFHQREKTNHHHRKAGRALALPAFSFFGSAGILPAFDGS
jgi:hypothetical protein